MNIEDNKHCNKEQLEYLPAAQVCFTIKLAQTTGNQVGLALVLTLCHFLPMPGLHLKAILAQCGLTL